MTWNEFGQISTNIEMPFQMPPEIFALTFSFSVSCSQIRRDSLYSALFYNELV